MGAFLGWVLREALGDGFPDCPVCLDPREFVGGAGRSPPIDKRSVLKHRDADPFCAVLCETIDIKY